VTGKDGQFLAPEARKKVAHGASRGLKEQIKPSPGRSDRKHPLGDFLPRLAI